MAEHRQLTLRLGHRTAFGADDFLVADSNYQAVKAIDIWPDWSSGTYVIWGPDGCGKSHLLQVWRSRSDCVVITGDRLGYGNPVSLLGGRRCAAIDDADGGLDEVALLQLYNILREIGGSLLLTARKPVREWGVKLPDLRSRLLAAGVAAIGEPDDDLLTAVIVKQFSDRQIVAPDDLVAYLVARIERSFAAARDIVRRLDEAGLEKHRRINKALARDLLSGEV